MTEPVIRLHPCIFRAHHLVGAKEIRVLMNGWIGILQSCMYQFRSIGGITKLFFLGGVLTNNLIIDFPGSSKIRRIKPGSKLFFEKKKMQWFRMNESFPESRESRAHKAVWSPHGLQTTFPGRSAGIEQCYSSTYWASPDPQLEFQ